MSEPLHEKLAERDPPVAARVSEERGGPEGRRTLKAQWYAALLLNLTGFAVMAAFIFTDGPDEWRFWAGIALGAQITGWLWMELLSKRGSEPWIADDKARRVINLVVRVGLLVLLGGAVAMMLDLSAALVTLAAVAAGLFGVALHVYYSRRDADEERDR